MNKAKKLTAVFLILLIIYSTFPVPTRSAGTTYTGVPGGQDIIKNASFSDIRGDSNADNIMKMSVYAIIRGYGNNIYKPNYLMGRQDVLAALVRTIGQQDAAVKQGDALKLQDPAMSSVDAYYKGHIEIARSSGIIKQSEIDALSALSKNEKAAIDKEVAVEVKKNWKMTKAEKDKLTAQKQAQRSYDKVFGAPATREEVAVWIARALNLQPASGEKTMSVYGYKDWKSIKTANIPYVEAVLNKEIMRGATGSTFSPKTGITRGNMAAILNAAANQSLDALGFTTGFGKISKVNVTKDVGAVNTTVTTDIVIDNPALESVNISVKKTSGRNVQNQETVPVIKNGRIGNEALLSKNDIVEYTINKDNQMLLIHVGRLKELQGKFLSYNPRSSTVQLLDSSNRKYTLKVLPDSIVQADKIPVDIGKVAKNTGITAVYGDNILKSMEVDVPAETLNNQDITAKIQFVSTDSIGKQIKILDENNNVQYYSLADNVVVYVNGEQQGLDEIGYDQDAVLKVSDGKVLEIKVFTDVPEDEVNRQLVFTAKLRSISGDKVVLSTDSEPDKQAEYKLDGNSMIIKDKIAVDYTKLRQGDRVKVYVNSAQDNYITRMEVQGKGVLVENIYKADIKDFSGETGEVILSNVYTYGFSGWVKRADNGKYKLSDNVSIYRGNNKLSAPDLKDYIGKTIYAATKEDYGDEEIVQAVVKDGFEDAIYKEISGIKWTTNEFTLSDGRTVSFLDGSIIVRDGRLLDTVDLSQGTGAFIIQNKTQVGISSAPLICLESFNAFSNYRITRGYLHNMGEDYYSVENAFRLTNNEWQSAGELLYGLNDETSIYDNTITNSFITAEKFAESRFKPYTYTWPNYKAASAGADLHTDEKYHTDYDSLKNSTRFHEHCLLYTVTDEEGNSIAVNIYTKDKNEFNDDKVYSERMAAGQFQSADVGNYTLTIESAREYSPLYDTWKPVNANITINTEKAIIIKDGKKIDLSDLQTGDNIYALSVDSYAVFIFVE